MLRIASDDAVWGNVATAWLADDKNRIDGHIACLYGSESQDGFGLVGKVGYSPPYHIYDAPRYILYSPVTQCNLNCIHCISSHTRTKVANYSEDIKQKIKSMCRSGSVERIWTDYSGDILWADHRFGGELEFLNSLNVPFHIATNGVYLTDDRAEKILRSLCASVNVSLDAACTQTYNKIRKGSPSLEEVIENIKLFQAKRAAREKPSRTALYLGFTLMCENIDELGAFIDLGASLGADMIACRHVEAYSKDMSAQSLWHQPHVYNAARTAAVERAAARGVAIAIPEAFDDRPVRTGHRPCSTPWSTAVILGNGDVQACCLPGTKIGNLNEQSFSEIWEGKTLNAFRLAVNSSTPPAPCSACAYARRPGNKYSYLPYEVLESWQSPYDQTEPV